MSRSSTAPEPEGEPAESPSQDAVRPDSQPTVEPPVESSAQPSGDPAPALASRRDPDAVALVAERREVREERLALRRERLAARRERVEARVERDLDELGSRVTPAMLRTGLREALVELAAAEQPATVQLTTRREDGSQVTREHGVYEVVLAALQAAPEFSALGLGGIAGDDDPDAPHPTDHRSSEARAVCLRHGIDDAQAARLRAKYPDAFKDVN